MSCWFGFSPPSRWAEYGLAPLADLVGDNEPTQLDEPLQMAVPVLDLGELVDRHDHHGKARRGHRDERTRS
jgi:hypothetical protein